MSHAPAFLVRPYAGMADVVPLLAVPHSHAPLEVIEEKNHIGYFSEYFGHLQCRTIVAELEYIDGDFLEDYANYYVRCFEPYRRFCRRLHFFDCVFDGAGFAALLEGTASSLSHDQLRAGYLGFIVVRDLPRAVIARTCLRTYPKDETPERRYPATRRYPVHLFGIELEVETLAFQEQDQVVAACATSAHLNVSARRPVLDRHRRLVPPHRRARDRRRPASRGVTRVEHVVVEIVHFVGSVGSHAGLIGPQPGTILGARTLRPSNPYHHHAPSHHDALPGPPRDGEQRLRSAPPAFDELEAYGWVTRSRWEGDRRKHRLEIHLDIEALTATLEGDLFGALSASDQIACPAGRRWVFTTGWREPESGDPARGFVGVRDLQGRAGRSE